MCFDNLNNCFRYVWNIKCGDKSMFFLARNVNPAIIIEYSDSLKPIPNRTQIEYLVKAIHEKGGCHVTSSP